MLSRKIAESGHYPAIDVEASISRVMHDVVDPAQFAAARLLKQLLSTYQHNRDLVAIGAYQAGSDPRIDTAIRAWPELQRFLQQDLHERVDMKTSVDTLAQMFGED